MSAAHRHPAGDDRWRSILVVLVLAGITFGVGQTIVAPALPQLRQAYGSDADTTAWVFSGFLLAACVSTPIAGRLGDVLGRSRVLGALLLTFGAGAVLCALSSSIELLIAGRVLQGLGGGVIPLTIAVVRDTFPAEKVPFGIGATGAIYGVGSALAYPLSGVVVDTGGVAWLFWLGAAAIPAGVAAARLIPSSRGPRGQRIDWRGAAVLSVALVLVLLGISQGNAWGWGATTFAVIAGGLATLAGWAVLQLRTPVPLVSVRILAQRPVLLVNLTTGLMGFAMLGTLVLIPTLAQVPRETGWGPGLSLAQTGVVLLPGALLSIAVAPFSGRLYARLGGRGLGIVGTGSMVVGFVWLLLLHGSAAALIVGSAVQAVGIALGLAATNTLLVSSVDGRHVGVNAAINAVMRYGFGALGTATLTAVLAAGTLGAGAPSEAAFRVALGLAALAALAGAVLLAALPAPGRGPSRRARRRPSVCPSSLRPFPSRRTPSTAPPLESPSS